MNKDFTLNDFWTQLQSIRIEGGDGWLPGADGMFPVGVDPDAIHRRVKGMIDAMTAEERADPDRIDATARERIAAAAGVRPDDVAEFLKQFEMVRALMRQMMNMTLWQRIKMVTGFGRLPPPPE